MPIAHLSAGEGRHPPRTERSQGVGGGVGGLPRLRNRACHPPSLSRVLPAGTRTHPLSPLPAPSLRREPHWSPGGRRPGRSPAGGGSCPAGLGCRPPRSPADSGGRVGRTQRVTEQRGRRAWPGPRGWTGARADPGLPEAGAPYLQPAQGPEAQEVARFLREALAEAGGRPLHGAGDLRRDVGQRPAPVQPQPPVPPFNPRPAPPMPLTAVNPRGGGAEADDQARPARGTASGPGSILQAEGGGPRRVSEPPPGHRVREGVRTTTPRRPCAGGAVKRRLRVLGKPQANRTGSRSHSLPASPRCAGEQRRLRKTVFFFLLTPSNFRWKCPGSAPGDSLAASQNYVSQKALRDQQLRQLGFRLPGNLREK